MSVSNVQDDEVQTALSSLVSYDNLVHASAGAIGSVVAMSLVYPLDSVRTRLQADDTMKAMSPVQAMKKLSQEEGFETLYRGIVPVLTSLCASNFVYFYSFNGMKATANSVGIRPSPFRDLIFGYVSGCINALITTPLWVANTRLKLQVSNRKRDGDKKDDTEKDKSETRQQKHLKGLIDGLITISREDGVSALWSGVETSFILSGNPAIHFMVYETLKRVFLKGRVKRRLSSYESFLIGGFAKCVATVVTYPLQLVQCRQRAAKKIGSTSPSGRAILYEVVRNSGLLGLYKGMETKLYQTVVAAAIMFLTYEKVIVFVHRLLRSRPK